jgi:deoxyribonuclease V
VLRPTFAFVEPPDELAAIEQQQILRTRVVRTDQFDGLHLVAGVDVGYEDDNQTVRAAVVVMTFPELAPIESVIARRPTSFPYVPGLLSFREIPVLIDALGKLEHRPDMILCDGNGLIHPRRFGLACHLGVLFDVPTIGVAKSHFIGTFLPVGPTAGEWQPLVEHDETIGAVLRTQTDVRPIYVSTGHRITLATAMQIVRRCTTIYRLPQTTRLADQLSKTKDW